MRGKNKIAAKLRRRQMNVIDEQQMKQKQKLAQDAKEQSKDTNNSTSDNQSFDPLARFKKSNKN